MKINLNFQLLILTLFIVLFCLNLILRIVPTLNYDFPFTMDQGRDMLDIRNIVVGKELTLLGPTTSINGLFLGPFWYYFNVIPFFISGGDPQYLVYWTIFWYMLAALTLFIFFARSFVSNKDQIYALLTSAIFLSVPAYFFASRHSFNANLMPPFTIFFFLSLFYILKKPSIFNSILLGLLSGIGLQIEAAFGILFLPFTFFILKINTISWRFIFYTVLAFGITLLPQVLFEIRNNFLMTKVFWGEINGSNPILINKLTFSDTLVSHFNSYLKIIGEISNLPAILNILLFLGGIIVAIYYTWNNFKQNIKTPGFISLLFLIWSFIFYSFYHFELKHWYITALYIPLLFIFSKFFVSLITSSNKFLSIASILFFLLFICSSIYPQLRITIREPNYHPLDPSNLRNLLKNIDIVYQNANGQPFKVYSYVPSVYDFPNQYLFWWYGTKKYGYQPSDISYLPDRPEYIANNQHFWNKTKPANENDLTYLIIEKDTHMPDREYAWLGNFTHLCLQEKKQLMWQAEIHILKKCDLE